MWSPFACAEACCAPLRGGYTRPPRLVFTRRRGERLRRGAFAFARPLRPLGCWRWAAGEGARDADADTLRWRTAGCSSTGSTSPAWPAGSTRRSSCTRRRRSPRTSPSAAGVRVPARRQPRVLRRQGVLQPLVPRARSAPPAPGEEVNSGGELWKALRAGSRRTRPSSTASPRAATGDRRGGGGRHRRHRRRLALRAAPGSTRVARDLGAAARVLPRAWTSTSPAGATPAWRRRSGGKAGHRPREALEAFRLAGSSEHLLADRAAPVTWLADHRGSTRTLAPRCGARPDRRGRARASRYRPERSTWAAASPSPTASAPPAPDGGLLLHRPCRGRLRRRDLRARWRGGARTLELWLEPGRSIAADTAILVTRVESEKTKRLRDQHGRVVAEDRWLLVDAGYNTVLRPPCCTAGTTRWCRCPGRRGAGGSFRVGRPAVRRRRVSAATTTPRTAGCPPTTAPGDLLAFYDAGRLHARAHDPSTPVRRPPPTRWRKRGGAAHPAPHNRARVSSRSTRRRPSAEAPSQT